MSISGALKDKGDDPRIVVDITEYEGAGELWTYVIGTGEWETLTEIRVVT